ncbi:major facilitator superfamily domain-containing protein [Kockovaella imperatae]|uniref:Major facilitator superfamily domain-containing protein n=1 Tax=Kockovaella imperatae TaxID=4999 RepID=A0A1Y1US84_9TREE|nr:major facilitator superfamily domain-containing protein [Kockovaella imperatae]ORX40812.1 major facilitator superfamily domain-containing protein [Kockovaella imperatae]
MDSDRIEVHRRTSRAEGSTHSLERGGKDMELEQEQEQMTEANPLASASTPAKSTLLLKRLRRKLPPPSDTRLMWIFVALMVTMLLLGWNDGSLGPLLPFLQRYYKINYLIISLSWLCNFAGGVFSGLAYIHITDRIGFGFAAALGALVQAIGYAFMSTGGPFALFLVGSGFLGFGFGFMASQIRRNIAQVNNITSRLPNASTKMFIVQACFGLGATVSPFISTPFAQHVKRAYLYFLVAMAVALAGMVIILVTVQGRTEAQCVGHLPLKEDEKRSAGESAVLEMNDHQDKSTVQGSSAAQALEIAEDPRVLPPAAIIAVTEERSHQDPAPELTSGQKVRMMLRERATWTLMAYNFVYVGCEVGLGGYLTSFLIHERGGTAAAGYATSGYWGGLTLGRVILIPVTNKLGYQTAIYTYTAIALVLEIIIWQTRTLIGNAVCFALVGVFLGPIYPAALMVISKILPDEIRGGVMGLTGTAGGAGAAAMPFVTGALSDRFGIWILQPFTVALLGADLILWFLVPTKRIQAKRRQT